MEIMLTGLALHVLIVARLLLKQLPHLPQRLLIVHVRSTPTETAARAQSVSTVIRTVPQMFKQLPAADVPRATTLRMVRTEQVDVRHVKRARLRGWPATVYHALLAPMATQLLTARQRER